MATRNILKDGEKALNKKSRAVTDFNARLHLLLDDMRETLIEANGLGLAAPQVGVLRRVALIVDTGLETEPPDETMNDIPDSISDVYTDEQTDEAENARLAEENAKRLNEQIIELVNPEIIGSSGEQTGSEGCLSVPGVYGIVTRPENVLVKAMDRYGQTFEMEVSELTARAVCHEIDHLDGVIFTSVAERLLTEEELAELAASRQAEREALSESSENSKEAENHR